MYDKMWLLLEDCEERFNFPFPSWYEITPAWTRQIEKNRKVFVYEKISFLKIVRKWMFRILNTKIYFVESKSFWPYSYYCCFIYGLIPTFDFLPIFRVLFGGFHFRVLFLLLLWSYSGNSTKSLNSTGLPDGRIHGQFSEIWPYTDLMAVKNFVGPRGRIQDFWPNLAVYRNFWGRRNFGSKFT